MPYDINIHKPVSRVAACNVTSSLFLPGKCSRKEKMVSFNEAYKLKTNLYDRKVDILKIDT